MSSQERHDYKGNQRHRKLQEDQVEGRRIYEKHDEAYIENGAYIETRNLVIGPVDGAYYRFEVTNGVPGFVKV